MVPLGATRLCSHDTVIAHHIQLSSVRARSNFGYVI